MKFLLDENVPEEIGKKLKSEGYKVEHINDKMHKGMKDNEVFLYSYRNKQTIISLDADFCSYKKQSHYGIIKISGAIINPIDCLLELISLYKTKGFENVYIQLDKNKAYIENKVFSKKNKFKHFVKLPIKLNSLKK